MVEIGEKQFGTDSAYLANDLTAEAKALRQLGRNDEAGVIERRLQSLQSTQASRN